jgi:hypothetical protein
MFLPRVFENGRPAVDLGGCVPEEARDLVPVDEGGRDAAGVGDRTTASIGLVPGHAMSAARV